VYLTPQGQTFTQSMAKELAKEEEIVLLCGHYEGIDERVLEEIVTDYVSIGDYVLTGGELPAMVMVDAISRMVPGVLTNGESGQTESFEGNLLEYPQYSRPEIWQKKAVPEVLLSGNQKKIAEWRKETAIQRTKERRPDLYQKYEKLQACREILHKNKFLHIDMTELISRGRAELVYKNGANICLYDLESGVYFHTADNKETGLEMLEHIVAHHKGEPELLALHQDFMVEETKKRFGMNALMTCYQAVYTRKEKLPVTGLYRTDGKETEDGLCIRRLTLKQLDVVQSNYATMDDPDYVRERIEKGAMYGAFVHGELAGFAGVHEEGSIGMLKVLNAYRGRKIGKALETYMLNLALEQGITPYGQVVEGNEISLGLQRSLGLCFSKEKMYWVGK
jgi:tRNA (guanine37-N1)-methyltransferase